MRNLLLTLGHNSSAILVEDDRIIWGYETERMSGTKSDSKFPVMVMNAKLPIKPDMIYATHWAPSGNLGDMSAKHWNPEYCSGIPVRTLSHDRTHHDTHIAGAMAYAGPEFTTRQGLYGLVIDGFGTCGEHFSIYRFERGTPRLIRRYHGYESSLGLWYQYATAFMGMKMHEDEYKLLGYEVHCPSHVVEKVEDLALAKAQHWVMLMDQSVYGSTFDPLYNISALAAIKDRHFEHLTQVCNALNISDPSSHDGRCILARYVQTVLEQVVLMMVDALEGQEQNVRHLLCSGGVFLNVKLNKRLIDYVVDGQVCVYPLAGDQGNALGLYFMDHPFFRVDGLRWGNRSLRKTGNVFGVHWMDEELAREYVIDRLRTVGYVNLVRGAMEFGPRALCNTTTLAVPTAKNVERINAANNRNTVMPMAPVMTRDMYEMLFKNTHKVWRSEEHMIVAMEYKDRPSAKLTGVAHKYTGFEGRMTFHTGRPQVVDERDPFMVDVLRAMGHPLINTSFNFHGKPIAFDTDSVIDNHRLQYERDDSFETVIIPN